jgi:hypothetical protein
MMEGVSGVWRYGEDDDDEVVQMVSDRARDGSGASGRSSGSGRSMRRATGVGEREEGRGIVMGAARDWVEVIVGECYRCCTLIARL